MMMHGELVNVKSLCKAIEVDEWIVNWSIATMQAAQREREGEHLVKLAFVRRGVWKVMVCDAAQM